VVAADVDLTEGVVDEPWLRREDLVHRGAVAARARLDVLALDLGGRARGRRGPRRLALRRDHCDRLLERGERDVEVEHVTGGDEHLPVVHPAVRRRESDPVLPERHLLELEVPGGIGLVGVELLVSAQQGHDRSGNGLSGLVMNRAMDDAQVGGERRAAPAKQEQRDQDGSGRRRRCVLQDGHSEAREDGGVERLGHATT
jgi:hypothetical protein